jgi:hypothetical protein
MKRLSAALSRAVLMIPVAMLFSLTTCALPPGGSVDQGDPGAAIASLMGVPTAATTVPAELKGLFSRSPLENSAPFGTQFPRVAFTVLSVPPNHAQNVQIYVTGGGQVPRGCWKLLAKVWTNATTSKDVGPFTTCVPDILMGARGVPLAGYNNWALAGQTMVNLPRGAQTTGVQRSQGPIPPDTPFPTGAQYTAYYGWQGGVNGRYPGGNTMEGYMWAGLMFGMGFDWNNIRDRRLWIYKYVAVEG